MKILSTLTITIFALLYMSCARSPELDEQVNLKASLPPEFNFSRRGLKVMSTLINKNKNTMSTLYGNNIAIKSAKAGGQQHSAGLEMALITWKQQPNPYWFGNNIPGQLLSIEMITMDKQTGKPVYSRLEGKIFKTGASDAGQRTDFILDQKPSVMP